MSSHKCEPVSIMSQVANIRPHPRGLTPVRPCNNNNINNINKNNNNNNNNTQVIEINGFKILRDDFIKYCSKKKNLSPFNSGKFFPMLPPPAAEMRDKITLCLDLDETLVHSSFTPYPSSSSNSSARNNNNNTNINNINNYDVKIFLQDGQTQERAPVYISFRPHVRTFISAIAPLFEIAIFTASQSGYANQVLSALDPEKKLGPLRLYREHCAEVNNTRVKDLSLLGRPLDRIALADNSPATYMFQPRNAIPVTSWFDDPNDAELLALIPLLQQLARAKCVYDVLDPFNAYLMK